MEEEGRGRKGKRKRRGRRDSFVGAMRAGARARNGQPGKEQVRANLPERAGGDFLVSSGLISRVSACWKISSRQ